MQPRLDLRQILVRSTSLSPKNNYEVGIIGGATVLRGTVATENDRLLAEALLRLEPGVGQIRNELLVQGNTPAASPQQ
jgi:hypothetical protein